MRLLPFLGVIAVASAQPKTFDGYNYVAPAGYVEKVDSNFVELTRTDPGKRFLCRLGLFRPQPALASVEQDLEAEWKAVVLNQFQITGPATTRPLKLAGASQNLARTAVAKLGNFSNLPVTLAVFRFPSQYVGILFSASSAEGATNCQTDFEQFVVSVRPSKPATSPATSASPIPTGPASNLYPGMPGWLPSGVGLPVPAPALVDGKPVGLWWRPAATPGFAEVRIYLPSGIRASNPRLGGPRLYDSEGQRRQPGATGVGTFEIGGGQIVERYDGFENRYPYTVNKDGFQIGAARFSPVEAVTANSLVGAWLGQSENFEFGPDGIVTYGVDSVNGRGRYNFDGYLLHIQPERGPGWVQFIGHTGVFLIRGTSVLQRRR